ncbi:MAG TPA: aldo/keto reductase [Chloroflexota bacterium]|nr:aldo/keto reductase [Chloroflexota bacterium]
MQYRQLGQSGLTVSKVGLGCNQFGRKLDVESTRAVVHTALEAGITLFDTAESYGDGQSERFLGEALKGRRQDAVIATKFGSPHRAPAGWAPGSRRNLRRAIEGSLSRLQTDYIDLYQLHFPDPRTPIEETLAALDEVVKEGKVRYIGCSNFSGWQVVEAEWIARTQRSTRFISAQNEYSLLNRQVEVELAPACVKYGVGILPYFPLANGLLTGKYRRGDPPPANTRLAARPDALTDDVFQRLDKLEAFAHDRGLSLLQVAIGGLAAQPAVGSVISGATSPDQVRANASAGEWTRTPEDLQALNEATL